MDHVISSFAALFTFAFSVISACHALLHKRDPRSALGWITVSLTVPLIGPILYWSMGVNRIRRRARQWQETGRRLAGGEAFSSRSNSRHILLPARGAHLENLRTLGDRVVSTELSAGNSLVPLHNGEEAYPAMIAAIDAATISINLSTYIFDHDRAGKRFAAALRRAAGRGVEVRVIIDGLGEKYSFPFASRLFTMSPVKARLFLPLRHGIYVNLRNHRKILVVDGKRGFTGGMNIGERHMIAREAPPPLVKDVHFAVAGPVVAELQRAFLADWHFVTGELVDDPRFFPPLHPEGEALVRVISDGPDKEYRKLHWIIMGALACARERVEIMTPYFIPDRPLISAMVTASLRGVAITLILPQSNNLPFVHWASRAFLWELLQHGIRVLFQPPPFVHTKMLLVDGVWSMIGSANLDPRSLRLNFELNLEIYDEEFNGILEREFVATATISREVTQEDMDLRSLPERFRDSTAKLFSPYL